MEYRIYIFLTNYRQMRDIYKKDIDVLFGNITEFLRSEMEGISGVIEASDYKSILIKGADSNDFNSIFSLAKNCGDALIRIKSLLKDFRTVIPVKIGIITAEESDKKHPFRSNLPTEEMELIPDILVSDRTSVSIIENYEVKACGLRNIWTTSGIEISRSKKIRNIYFNRDEEDILEEFIGGAFDENILYIWGEKGSGKSGIIKEVTGRAEGGNIILLREKRNNTREFKIIHDIIYHLLFRKRNENTQTIDDVIRRIENSAIAPMNKSNLIYFIKLLFTEIDDEDIITFSYNTYKSSLKKALTDSLKINAEPCTVIIDDHQWVSRNCEELIMYAAAFAQGDLRLVLCSDDKNNSNNIPYPVRYLHIGELNKVQISKMLQMLFPRMKIEGRTADFIHKATGGNLYTVLEFTQYLTGKGCFSVTDGKVSVNYPDLKNIPDNLTDMFTDKVSSLSPNASDILRIICIMGEEFYPSDLDWLLHVINYPADEQAALKELDDAGIIENRGDHYILAESSIISGIYNNINEKNRKLIHGLLGELFETKGAEKFGFKIFLHYLKAENYEKIIAILPDILSKAHKLIHFNALKNMFDISDKLLFRLCVKENLYPIEVWLENLKFSRFLFDSGDPLDTVKRFEKAIDHLIKIEKETLTLDLYEILLRSYIDSDKFKKASQYVSTGLKTAEKYQSAGHRLMISLLDLAIRIRKGDFSGITDAFGIIEKEAAEDKKISESEDFIYINARVCLLKNETDKAHELLSKLLDLYTSSLDFDRAGEITRLMIEISLTLRDHRSAEEFCKYILSSEKGSASGSDETVRTNILLARLYGYQNKFLQAVSLLESLCDKTKKTDLRNEIIYELGSLYQFHNEKELALSTFKAALVKDKKQRKNNDQAFEIKYALLLASQNEYREAEDALKKCTGGSCKLIISVIRFLSKKGNDTEAENLFKAISEAGTVETDLIFETALLLLNSIGSRRKFDLCRMLLEIMSLMVNNVRDYNLVLEFNKTAKSLHRNSVRTKKNMSEIKKVTPSVRKRVKNRRNA